MLYHVSVSKIKGNEFTPRIPKQRIEGEDKTVNRICFCDSIQGCLSAMPTGIQVVKNLLYLSRIGEVTPLLYVYELDETKLPVSNIKYPGQLKSYVTDASLTGEHWIINQGVECRERLIKITSFKRQYVRVPGKDTKIDFIVELNYSPIANIPDNRPEIFLKSIKATQLRKILGGFDFETRSEAQTEDIA